MKGKTAGKAVENEMEAIAEIKPGDRVIRKSGRLVIGVVENVYHPETWHGTDTSRTLARVRWEKALRPFRGGYSDNHTSVRADSLTLATDEVIAERTARARELHRKRLRREYGATNIQHAVRMYRLYRICAFEGKEHGIIADHPGFAIGQPVFITLPGGATVVVETLEHWDAVLQEMRGG